VHVHPHPTAGGGGEIPLLNIVDPAFDPLGPGVFRAQEGAWYARTPLGVAALRYDEVAALLKDRRLRQGAVSHLAVQGITAGPLAEWWSRIILNVEGEAHDRQRRLVRRAFTPRAVEALRPAMRAVAGELVDAFAPAGRCDFMAQFADPYPSRIICALLGVPREEQESFRGWANTLGLAFSFEAAAQLERIEVALHGLLVCVDGLLAARRAAPGDDLVSALLGAEDGGDRLTTDELRALLTGLVFAGQDTTRNQLGLGMELFLRHPRQWARLGAEPELAAGAAEEIMRCAPTVPVILRLAEADLEVGGLPVPAGTHLALFVGAANRDPRVFGAAPESFDIACARPAQLTFGGGIHYCLGAPLARAELQEALPILARRLRHPEPDGPATWRPALGITGPQSLPLRFQAMP
jgi:cytochrome P450